MMSRLKFYRLKAGLTQEDVAKELAVNQAAVSNWERGLNPPLPKYRKKLRALYHATEDELFPKEEQS
jgi:transcriptional regulator with XRE-family HTH domain